MKNDFLKDFIDNNRERFDDAELPQQSFDDTMNRMRGRKARKNKKLIFTSVAAACVVFLIASFFLSSSTDTSIETNEKPATVQNAIQPKQESEEPIIQNTEVEQNEIVIAQKPKPIIHKKSSQSVSIAPTDITTEIQTILETSGSTAEKIAAVQRTDGMEDLGDQLKSIICTTFETDESTNVRLVALTVLAKHTDDPLVRKSLSEGLIGQTDPAIQMALIRIMSSDPHPGITEGLMEMASNPFTISPVRDEANYALLTRKN